MARESDNTPVPVDLLRMGLYVAELDRPWVETSFVFQGFLLEEEQQLDQLRQQCRFVFVDVERSDARAVEALWGDLAQPNRSGSSDRDEAVATRTRPDASARRQSAGVLRTNDPYPDAERFAVLVQAAAAAREQALETVNEALAALRADRPIDGAAVQAAVEEMMDVILEDSTAALWLTNLKRHHDDTASHSVNVAILALALASHLGHARQTLAAIGMGALLHDVGKIRVPTAVLDKSDELTPDEQAMLRRHPEVGYELVASAGEVPAAALDVIRLHHERIDGGGYPYGLEGDRIPDHVRLVALCNAFDAMTRGQGGRPAMAPDKVMQALYSQAPGQFGIDLVQEFIRCLGIFPVGSVVELDNGVAAVVVAAPTGAGLWPVVLLVRAADGIPFEKRMLVNLGAARGTADEVAQRRIRRALEPAAAQVDVAGIVASEFGMDVA